MRLIFISCIMATAILTGCASTNQRVLDADTGTQLQKRSYQSRVFETSDREKVLRATISTLQDLGFVIDRADLTLGAVSATKVGVHRITMTVTVRPQGSDRMLVRANAQFNITPIEDPKQYQDFFSSLEKSLFLAAHTEG